MPFEKGHKKHGGRNKGTPNKRTQELHEICEEMGIDPFRALLDLSQKAEKEENRLGALKEVCQYLYPKRKAIEVSGELNNPYADKSLEELEAIIKEKIT